jgi:SpoVK/Ycf46/Vps4 family AAA+-type ATPase
MHNISNNNDAYEPFNRKNKQKNRKHKSNSGTIINNHYHMGAQALSPTENNTKTQAKEIIDRYSLNKPVINTATQERFSPYLSTGSPTNKSPTFEDQQSSDNIKFVHIIKPTFLESTKSDIRKKILEESKNDEQNELFEEVLISEPIGHITDLINISEKNIIKPNVKYSIDLLKLKNIVPHLKELTEMIGMEDIKKSLTYQLMYFLQGFEFKHMLHTIIEGPPGVGKTCLGKILGKIYLDLECINKDAKPQQVEEDEDGPMNIKKLLSTLIHEAEAKQPKKNIFKIAKRSDLVGQYVGHTAIKTQKIINESFGGVLFIDEAYSLGGDDAFSKECINTINQNLSENGDKFICIIAGYSDALESSFFSLNSGLHRRFPFRFKIEKYSGEELTQILRNKMIKEKYNVEETFDSKLSKFIEENKECFPNFGGDIETYFFHIKMMHSTRVFGKSVCLRNIFIKDDFVNALLEVRKNQKKEDKKLDMYN